jgi:hypothetical protein
MIMKRPKILDATARRPRAVLRIAIDQAPNYKVKRVVIGENKNFMGGEELLLNKGKEVVVLDNGFLMQLQGDREPFYVLR